MSEQQDPRLIKVVKEANLSYLEKDKTLLIKVPLENERSQIVFLDSNTFTYADVEMRKVWAIGYIGEYPQPNVLAYCLTKNADYKIGAWEANLDPRRKQCQLAFSVSVGATLDPKRLKTVIYSAATIADELERKLSDDDLL